MGLLRYERLGALQAFAWLFALTGLVASYLLRSQGNHSFAILASLATILILFIHNVIHFLKIDSIEDFTKRETYTNFGLLGALLLQIYVLTTLLYLYILPRLDAVALGGWYPVLVRWLIPVTIIFLVILVNLLPPSRYRIEDLRRRSTLRQTQALRELRESIRQRTEELLAMGVLPELQRARRGKEVSVETLEESLRLALQKIGGIEQVLQYMILDKYLELLESGRDSMSRSVLWKWATALWVGLVFLYQIVMAILSLINALQSVISGGS